MCVCSKPLARKTKKRGRRTGYGKYGKVKFNACWDELVANHALGDKARSETRVVNEFNAPLDGFPVPRKTITEHFKKWRMNKVKRRWKESYYLPSEDMEEFLCAFLHRDISKHIWHELLYLSNKAYAMKKKWLLKNKRTQEAKKLLPPSPVWIKGFLVRHPALGARVLQNRSRTRLLNTTPKRLGWWFKTVNEWFEQELVSS
jgi:hypothetical protein